MSKEVKNSKTEVPCGICMNDKDYMNSILSSLKEMSKNYVVALTEASNEVLFKKLKKDFDKIYIMVGSNNINDLKYLNKDVIIEFMEPSSLVYLYDLNRNEKILKVGNLLFNIY